MQNVMLIVLICMGDSPLILLVKRDTSIDILKYLRGKGANPFIKTTKLWTRWNASYFPGLTLVHIACLEGHEEMMRYLTEDCGIDPMSKDEQGVTPLHLACLSGHADIAKYLIIEQYCDPHLCLNDGRTCLHAASGGGNLNMIKYLITKCNCNASTQDDNNHVPSYYALEKGHLKAAKYLGTLPNENDKKELFKFSGVSGI